MLSIVDNYKSDGLLNSLVVVRGYREIVFLFKYKDYIESITMSRYLFKYVYYDLPAYIVSRHLNTAEIKAFVSYSKIDAKKEANHKFNNKKNKSDGENKPEPRIRRGGSKKRISIIREDRQ